MFVEPPELPPEPSPASGQNGDALAIEYRDGGEPERFKVTPGQADWDEPTDRVYRGVNAVDQPYEEITVFFLDYADADPQPIDDSDPPSY